MRIAVIGSGISGLAAAWLLRKRHEVWLFEAEGRAGGHTHTVVLEHQGAERRLETGFMVFNRVTYPYLVRLFDHLGIASQPAEMSYSLACHRCRLEWSGRDLDGLFAQRGNLLRPSFLRLLAGVVRFNREAHRMLSGGSPIPATVGDLVAQGRLGRVCFEHYLLPMAAAIWSAPVAEIRGFPLAPLLRFYANHGLLGVATHHPWFTVVGGARTYVDAMVRDLGQGVRLDAAVAGVRRDRGAVDLRFADGGRDRFDRVVVATHADQALALLEDPSPPERDLLGAWTYSSNDTFLHCDRSFLPAARPAWSSWNSTLEDCQAAAPRASHTYLLNRLQSLEGPTPYQVTLNPLRPIDPAKILRHMTMTHPRMTAQSLATQPELPGLNGCRSTYFCGAYFGNGFHEDGLVAAIRVAEDLGEAFP